MADIMFPFEECDAKDCPARAYHEVVIDITLPGLHFCQHHFAALQGPLLMQAVQWIDNSAALYSNTRPDASA